ncbi:MAG: ATP-binding cassette domain-containing protein [Oscillospiraceae bacterium]
MSVHKHENCGDGCHGVCCLRVEDLGVNFGEGEVLSHVNLHLHCGEIVALIGPNGAGKSSLFRAILGQTAHTGSIHFERAGVKRHGPSWAMCPKVPPSTGGIL